MTRVETTLIFSLMKDGFVPVIAPVGVDDEGHTYNINADAVAGAVAGALRARRLIMLTDVAGVLDPGRQAHPVHPRRGRCGPVRERHRDRRHDPQVELLYRRHRTRR